MVIYVKDNVERITDDDIVARRLLSEGYKAVTVGSRVIPTVKPVVAEVKPQAEATASVQRRRRYQRRTPNTEAE